MRESQTEPRWGRSSSFTKDSPFASTSDGFTPVQGVAKRNSSILKRSGLSRFYSTKARSFACMNEVTELARLYGDSSCARILSKLSSGSSEPAPARPTLSAPSSPSRNRNPPESDDSCDTCNIPCCHCRPSTPAQRWSSEHKHSCQDYGIQSMCLALERAHVTAADGDAVATKKALSNSEVLWSCWEITA